MNNILYDLLFIGGIELFEENMRMKENECEKRGRFCLPARSALAACLTSGSFANCSSAYLGLFLLFIAFYPFLAILRRIPIFLWYVIYFDSELSLLVPQHLAPTHEVRMENLVLVTSNP